MRHDNIHLVFAIRLPVCKRPSCPHIYRELFALQRLGRDLVMKACP